mgnify:CR=1 FL=1
MFQIIIMFQRIIMHEPCSPSHFALYCDRAVAISLHLMQNLQSFNAPNARIAITGCRCCSCSARSQQRDSSGTCSGQTSRRAARRGAQARRARRDPNSLAACDRRCSRCRNVARCDRSSLRTATADRQSGASLRSRMLHPRSMILQQLKKHRISSRLYPLSTSIWKRRCQSLMTRTMRVLRANQRSVVAAERVCARQSGCRLRGQACPLSAAAGGCRSQRSNSRWLRSLRGIDSRAPDTARTCSHGSECARAADEPGSDATRPPNLSAMCCEARVNEKKTGLATAAHLSMTTMRLILDKSSDV